MSTGRLAGYLSVWLVVSYVMLFDHPYTVDFDLVGKPSAIVVSREVRIDRSDHQLMLELDFGTACRALNKRPQRDRDCFSTPGNGPIHIIWSLSDLGNNIPSLGGVVETNSTQNFNNKDKYTRFVAVTHAPPGRYLLSATISNDDDLAGVPAQLTFWRNPKHITSWADELSWLLGFFNLLIVAPVTFILVLIFIYRVFAAHLSARR